MNELVNGFHRLDRFSFAFPFHIVFVIGFSLTYFLQTAKCREYPRFCSSDIYFSRYTFPSFQLYMLYRNHISTEAGCFVLLFLADDLILHGTDITFHMSMGWWWRKWLPPPS
ncbi:hypothetical protein JB92DRAFT_814950 [Gautieria morchelliformis]|nr:hypothetical protein JB92DRAFT_814950 [Gautieria morchelliformis]